MAPSGRGRISFAGPLALVAGLLLAQAVIYAATGWRDGFMDPDLWRLKRRMLRTLPWTLPAAACVGAGLAAFHARWIAAPPGRPLAGAWLLPALLRLFLHFPFYGFLVLFQFMAAFVMAPFRARQARGQGAASGAWAESMTGGTGLWMLLGPMAGMKDEEGQPLRLGTRAPDLAGRLPWLLPLLLGLLAVWSGATSEDTGDRVDGFLLSLAATVWLGDFLLLAWLGRPPWLGRIGGAGPRS